MPTGGTPQYNGTSTPGGFPQQASQQVPQQSQGKGPVLQRWLAPLVALALCLAAAILPWFKIPLLGELGIGTAKGIFSIVSLFFGAEVNFDGSRTLEALGDVIGSLSASSIGIAVALVLVTLALVLAAFAFAIVACFRGPLSGARKGIATARVSFLLLALALLLDCVFFFIANIWLSEQVLTLLQSFGASDGELSIIKPSVFAWALLAASVVCWIAFGVVKRFLRTQVVR
jgi:hypothetical protein